MSGDRKGARLQGIVKYFACNILLPLPRSIRFHVAENVGLWRKQRMTSMENSHVHKIGFSDLAIIILENKWTFLACMAACCIAGLGVAELPAARYCASAVVAKPINKKTVNLGLMLSGSKRVSRLLKTLDLKGQSETSEFLGILSSKRIAEDAINRFGLAHAYGFGAASQYCMEDVLKRYYRNVDANEDSRGNIIITVTDTDPRRASDIANYVACDLDTVSRSISAEHGKRSRVFFEEQVEIAKRNLDSASQKLAAFRTENNFYDLDQQKKTSIGSLASVEAEKMSVNLQENRIRSEFGKADLRLAELEERETVLDRIIHAYMRSKGANPPLVDMPRKAVALAQLLRIRKSRNPYTDLCCDSANRRSWKKPIALRRSVFSNSRGRRKNTPCPIAVSYG